MLLQPSKSSTLFPCFWTSWLILPSTCTMFIVSETATATYIPSNEILFHVHPTWNGSHIIWDLHVSSIVKGFSIDFVHSSSSHTVSVPTSTRNMAEELMIISLPGLFPPARPQLAVVAISHFRRWVIKLHVIAIHTSLSSGPSRRFSCSSNRSLRLSWCVCVFLRTKV